MARAKTNNGKIRKAERRFSAEQRQEKRASRSLMDQIRWLERWGHTKCREYLRLKAQVTCE